MDNHIAAVGKLRIEAVAIPRCFWPHSRDQSLTRLIMAQFRRADLGHRQDSSAIIELLVTVHSSVSFITSRDRQKNRDSLKFRC